MIYLLRYLQSKNITTLFLTSCSSGPSLVTKCVAISKSHLISSCVTPLTADWNSNRSSVRTWSVSSCVSWSSAHWSSADWSSADWSSTDWSSADRSSADWSSADKSSATSSESAATSSESAKKFPFAKHSRSYSRDFWKYSLKFNYKIYPSIRHAQDVAVLVHVLAEVHDNGLSPIIILRKKLTKNLRSRSAGTWEVTSFSMLDSWFSASWVCLIALASDVLI